MRFDFHPEAETELLETITYYEDRRPNLGEDFSIEFQLAVQNILSYPRGWPVIAEEVHRCLVNRFPYGILYSIEPDRVLILAVMHLHRHPGYWKDRR